MPLTDPNRNSDRLQPEVAAALGKGITASRDREERRFRIESAIGGYRSYRVVPSPKCNVEHIPWVLRAKEWNRALALMERWFREKESTDKSLPPDTTTITMEWLLDFRHVEIAYYSLTDPLLWTAENGRDSQGNVTSPIQRLCKQLSNRGLLTSRREVFDDFHEPTPLLRTNKRQIDAVRIFHAPPFRPDDLTASLANFELFLVVAGYVEPSEFGTGHSIVIEKTGVFMQDDYDFNDEPGGGLL